MKNHKKIIFELDNLNEFPLYNVKILVDKSSSGKHSTYTVSVNEYIDNALDSLNRLRDNMNKEGISWTVYYIEKENSTEGYKILEVAESKDEKISERTKFNSMKTQNYHLTRLVEKLDLIIEKSPLQY
jgi:predicted HNH restriction endonuclease